MKRLKMMTAYALLAMSAAAISSAQQLSPYSAFSSLSAAQLAGTQVRFTYVGALFGGTSSAAFTTTGRTLDLSGFIQYYRSGYAYGGDGTATADFTATTGELKAMIDSVGTLPAVTAGTADSSGILS